MQMSNGKKIIAMAVILQLLAYLAVGLRFMSRRMKRQKWGIDDWLVTVALFPITGLLIQLIYGCASGALANHITTDDQGNPIITEQVIAGAKIAYAYQLMESPTLSLLKLSVLFCYRRIFDAETFKKVNMTMIILIGPWAVAGFCLNLFDCGTHISANYSWNLDYTNEYCGGSAKIILPYIIMDVILDTLILVQPVPMIWRLQMPGIQKLAITGTFFLGSLAVCAAITRLTFYIILVNATIEGSTEFDDEMQIFTWTTTFTFIEVALSTVSSCLPTLRPVAATIIPSLNRMFQSRNGLQAGSGNKYKQSDAYGASSRTSTRARIQIDPDSTSVSSTSRLHKSGTTTEQWPTEEDIELQPHAN